MTDEEIIWSRNRIAKRFQYRVQGWTQAEDGVFTALHAAADPLAATVSALQVDALLLSDYPPMVVQRGMLVPVESARAHSANQSNFTNTANPDASPTLAEDAQVDHLIDSIAYALAAYAPRPVPPRPVPPRPERPVTEVPKTTPTNFRVPALIVGYCELGQGASFPDENTDTLYVGVREAIKRERAGFNVRIVLHRDREIDAVLAGPKRRHRASRDRDLNPDGWIRPQVASVSEQAWQKTWQALKDYFSAPKSKCVSVPRDQDFVSGATYPQVIVPRRHEAWGQFKDDNTRVPYERWERQLDPIAVGGGQIVWAAVSPDHRTIYVREDTNLFQVGREEF